MFWGSVNVKPDLSNYATKTDFKNGIKIDTSKLAGKSDLDSLKVELDKLDIEKLIPIPIDLSTLGDVVKHDNVKKTVYDKLVAKVNNIDINEFVLKTKYETDNLYLDKKIPDTSEPVKKLDYNANINKIESKIQNISDLVTNVQLTAVDNKMPNIKSLVKKL